MRREGLLLLLVSFAVLAACNPFSKLGDGIKAPSFDASVPNLPGAQGQPGTQNQGSNPGAMNNPPPNNGSNPNSPGGGGTGFVPNGASGNPGGFTPPPPPPPPHMPGAKVMFQMKGVQ